MIYVGIDWSSQYDDICFINAKGEKIKEFRININSEGFNELLSEIHEAARSKAKVLIGIEDGKNILADFLHSKGYKVFSLDPKKVKRFKEVYSAVPKKDDRFDAFSIALFLLKERKNFEPVSMSGPQCEELRWVCETRDRLVRERTRCIQQLRSDLSLYFPAFSTFFKSFKSSVPLNLIRIIPGPSALKNLGFEGFLEQTSSVRYFPEARKRKCFHHLKTQTIFFTSLREQALASRAIMMSERILELQSQIAIFEKQARQISDAHPLGKVFSSLPGTGSRLGPKLLALFGDDKTRFDSYQSVQCYAGTAPVSEKSGKYLNTVRMRRACNKALRNVIYQFSFSSVLFEPWAKEFYEENRKRGKSHSRAVRALGNKWVKIIFRMWKDEALYDSSIFTTKRNRNCAA